MSTVKDFQSQASEWQSQSLKNLSPDDVRMVATMIYYRIKSYQAARAPSKELQAGDQTDATQANQDAFRSYQNASPAALKAYQDAFLMRQMAFYNAARQELESRGKEYLAITQGTDINKQFPAADSQGVVKLS